MAIDTVAVEVMRNRLISIVYEMGAVLRRTGHSPNIREREDCSCILADDQGQLIAQAEHIPGHLGMLITGMKSVMKHYPVDSWRPGDVAMFNDPYEGGSHLPDIRIVVPVFYDGALVGFSATLAHHADVGGMAPGSMPATATEIFQEGIQIPYVKLYNEGVLNEDILKMVLANVRTPEEREGDIKAQVAAAQLGQRRVREVIDKIGLTTYVEYKDEILNQSERLVRARIRQLPKGVYKAWQYIDDDGTKDDPITIAITLLIEDDSIKVDFEGTTGQRIAAVNSMWGQSISAVYYVVKSVIDPDIPVNSGCYRPVEITAPLGSIVRPTHPHSVAASNESQQRISEVLIAAFAQADPRLVRAPSHGCMNNVVFGGIYPNSGNLYAYYETIGGGDGARYNKDGNDGVHINGTNTMNTPIEVLEMTFPLRIEEYSLIQDSPGAGKYRGGMGLKRKYQVLDHRATLVVSSDWIKRKADGLHGGGRGSLTKYVINEGMPTEEIPPLSKFIRTLFSGDTLTVYTGGGNGFGDVKERDRGLIANDLKNGKITEEWLRRDGLVILSSAT